MAMSCRWSLVKVTREIASGSRPHVSRAGNEWALDPASRDSHQNSASLRDSPRLRVVESLSYVIDVDNDKKPALAVDLRPIHVLAYHRRQVRNQNCVRSRTWRLVAVFSARGSLGWSAARLWRTNKEEIARSPPHPPPTSVYISSDCTSCGL